MNRIKKKKSLKNAELNIQGCKSDVSVDWYSLGYLTHLNSPYRKEQVNDQVQYRAILMEATSKDPWNVSNTKL